MDLLLIGDGGRYIDLSKAHKVDLGGATYWESAGIWVRQQAGSSRGQLLPEREAFLAFMRQGRFTEAGKHFPELFKDGSKVQAARQPDKRSYAKAKTISRFTAVGILGLLFAAYIAAVVTGNISPGHQLSTADVIAAILVAVAIGLLLRAEFLRDIQEFGFGGLNVKMRNKVQDLEETQKDQSKELEELRFTLLLLVTDNERKHLENLLAGDTSKYQRNDSMQAELRRLRAISLIRSKRYIAEMPDHEFDLSDWAELTDRGREYLQHWEAANVEKVLV